MRSSRSFTCFMVLLTLVLALGAYFLFSGLTMGDAPLMEAFAPRFTL